MNIQLLLSEVSQISKKYDLINQKTGGYFNIFNIANISTDEVSVCRIIYELINPKGSHYQGDTYLRFFMENVLKIYLTDYEYRNIHVYRERVIKDGRRVDLVIETIDKIIPIEVKIYAGDQYRQCFDYYTYAKHSNIFYLTIDGRCPSNYSANGLTPVYNDLNEISRYKEVTQISFEEDILTWLSKCISHQETIKISPIREILLQFREAIRNMTNLIVKENEDEIISLLSSKENIKSAIQIEKSLKKSKINMMKKVLESIECRLDTKLKSENKLDYFSYKKNNFELVNTYYDRKKPTWPGLSYFVKNLDIENVDLLLRFEIGDKIFVGFCTSYKDRAAGKRLSNNKITELLEIDKISPQGWWIYWEYMPVNSINCPNFKIFNDAYFDLYDDYKFEKFIDSCEKSIFDMLNKLKDKNDIKSMLINQ